MRVAVTGRKGQVSTALQRLAEADDGVEVVALGRPEMDLADAASVHRTLKSARPDLVVNAAAYTAVDKAEDDEAAAGAVNALGAGHVAKASAELGVPLFQLSTDYVFDGQASRPYREDDPPAPLGAYGRSKLEGERAAAFNPHHAILRTAWVHSPFGPNFVLTMLRLALTRAEIGVVADQVGSPTAALDIAEAILRMAPRIVDAPGDPALNGVFHVVSSGSTSWAGLAAFLFEASTKIGGPVARVREITTADYPTRAKRPANSRLGGTRLARGYGIDMPDWRIGVAATVSTILREGRHLT